MSVLICANFVLTEETSDTTIKEQDWKDKTQQVFDETLDGAKKVGSAVADSTKSGYDATKQYFSNNTVGDIAGDVADGAKQAGQSIAEGAKKAWKSIGDFFS